MKISLLVNTTALGCIMLFLSSCATDQSKTSTASSTPQPNPPLPENTGTTLTPPAQEPAEATPPSVPVDDGSGKIIPINDLPKKDGIPYAVKTKWAGFVKSPYAQDKIPVDVRSFKPGSKARCPHTDKIFIVP